MGLFGFGKSKHSGARAGDGESEDDDSKIGADVQTEDTGDSFDEPLRDFEGDAGIDESDEADDGFDDDDDAEPLYPSEPTEEYEGRGEDWGPWDIDDEDTPDYSEYLDLGAYYLPFLQGIELRIKANRANQEVLGCTVTYGASSLEIEALAAPKTLGLWDDVRADLLNSNDSAKEVPGVFGMELSLPVTIKGGKKLVTRIVGVDGPRWMLRGIFSGSAANNPHSEEAEALNRFFADIVVDRGTEPLAPRDLVPMHPPVTPNERRKAEEEARENGNEIPKRIDGPFVADQEVNVQTTISRGPMFSEVR